MSDQPGASGSGESQPAEPKKISWDEAKALVGACKVDTVYQAHSRGVWLTLKDGTRVETVSPALDDIVYVLGDHPDCDEVPVIME